MSNSKLKNVFATVSFSINNDVKSSNPLTNFQFPTFLLHVLICSHWKWQSREQNTTITYNLLRVKNPSNRHYGIKYQMNNQSPIVEMKEWLSRQ